MISWDEQYCHLVTGGGKTTACGACAIWGMLMDPAGDKESRSPQDLSLAVHGQQLIPISVQVWKPRNPHFSKMPDFYGAIPQINEADLAVCRGSYLLGGMKNRARFLKEKLHLPSPFGEGSSPST